MVELKITGCCNHCPHIDLDLRKADFSSFDDNLFLYSDGNLFLYSISCIHEKVCGMLEKELSDGKADENV